MNPIRLLLRGSFARLEPLLDRVFTPAHNPLKQLGALGFLFLWIVIASGVHVYVGFDTSVGGAHASVDWVSESPWFLFGVSRSLHRYASDALVLVVVLHLLREFSLDRYRGARWFSWTTGAVAIFLIYAAGIGGYWLVWDRLAQFIAIVTSEWLDALPIFGQPIAGNFVAPDALDDRFFTLLMFLHLAVPLMLGIALWLHLQRISRPALHASRPVAIVGTLTLVALSVAYPARSQAPADLATVPAQVAMDWFYLPAYPLLDRVPRIASWIGFLVLAVGFVALPFLPPQRRRDVAHVDLAMCNGCGRCHDDCPYGAVAMVRRSDGRPFEVEARVDPALCIGCGICVGACPPSTPFRSTPLLPTGIDLPDPTLAGLRAATLAAGAALGAMPQRVLVFGCRHGAAGVAADPGTVMLPCLGMLPPSFIDFVLSRRLADGVLLAGCGDRACRERLGQLWTEARLAGVRDPRLRNRVDRARLATCWAGPAEAARLTAARAALAVRVAATARSQAVQADGSTAPVVGVEGD